MRKSELTSMMNAKYWQFKTLVVKVKLFFALWQIRMLNLVLAKLEIPKSERTSLDEFIIRAGDLFARIRLNMFSEDYKNKVEAKSKLREC